ncbi:MAG: SusC/RagA family TonB-linked outer membrane protein, partial [Candidatus Atribacteria bacterium]
MKKRILFLLLCFASVSLMAQRITVTGKVTEADGTPIPGVNVFTKNMEGTITSNEGNYALYISSDADEITYSFIGMKDVTEKINGRTVINVVMEEESIGIESVVVTALGITRDAKALSYAQQGVNVAMMNEAKSTNIVNSLSGKISGVQVIPAGYNTGSARIIIRGNNSLTGNNQPLFVVDGLPIDNTAGDGSIDYGNNAADLNPEDIESMEVLKGPNASALYGSRAANGVILITTKKGSPQFKVTLGSNFLFQTITEFPEYQNAYGVGTSCYIDRTNAIPNAVVNYRSWGSPMLGQPYVALDGEIKPYLPQPDNVPDFYQTAQLITNN